MSPYQQGYKAWLDGMSEHTNPFKPESAAGNEWLDGWMDAADDYVNAWDAPEEENDYTL